MFLSTFRRHASLKGQALAVPVLLPTCRHLSLVAIFATSLETKESSPTRAKKSDQRGAELLFCSNSGVSFATIIGTEGSWQLPQPVMSELAMVLWSVVVFFRV